MLVLMMCCMAIAFASCKPDPEPTPDPTPDPTPAPANEIFLGDYSGKIYLNGIATAPQFQSLQLPLEYPIDSMEFPLNANITAGDTDKSVNVAFSINEESYNTTGTVNGSQIIFGVLSYTYVEGPSTFHVNLNLTGDLITNSDKNRIELTGPFDGTGNVTIEGFPVPLDLTVEGTVTGTLSKNKRL